MGLLLTLLAAVSLLTPPAAAHQHVQHGPSSEHGDGSTHQQHRRALRREGARRLILADASDDGELEMIDFGTSSLSAEVAKIVSENVEMVDAISELQAAVDGQQTTCIGYINSANENHTQFMGHMSGVHASNLAAIQADIAALGNVSECAVELAQCTQDGEALDQELADCETATAAEAEACTDDVHALLEDKCIAFSEDFLQDMWMPMLQDIAAAVNAANLSLTSHHTNHADTCEAEQAELLTAASDY